MPNSARTIRVTWSSESAALSRGPARQQDPGTAAGSMQWSPLHSPMLSSDDGAGKTAKGRLVRDPCSFGVADNQIRCRSRNGRRRCRSGLAGVVPGDGGASGLRIDRAEQRAAESPQPAPRGPPCATIPIAPGRAH